VATLDDVNRLAAGGTDEFRFESFDGSRLVLIGSFDLSYYHDVELTFVDVEFIHCPTYMLGPRFRETGPKRHGRGFEIATTEGLFEIIADSVSVLIGKVYHYDRGDALEPGERIADWVKRDRP